MGMFAAVAQALEVEEEMTATARKEVEGKEAVGPGRVRWG